MVTTVVAVSIAVLVVPLAGGLALWAGMRNGDRSDDVRTTAILRPASTGTLIRAEVTNPSQRPVIVTMRVATSSWLVDLIWSPPGRRTRLLPTSRHWDGSGVLDYVPAFGMIPMEVPLPAGPAGAVRVHLTAYERPGRVRTATHRLAVPHPGTGPAGAQRRSVASIGSIFRTDPRRVAPRDTR